MTVLTNSDLRFKINFHRNTKKFDFTEIFDDTGWDYYLTGVSLSYLNVEGLIKGVSPSLTTFYNGTAYNNDDFTTPTVKGVGSVWTASTLALPTTLASGNYTFYYKARVQLGLGSGVGLPAFSKAGGVFSVTATDYITALLGTTPTGLKLQVESTTPGRSGVFDITSCAFSTDSLITVTGAGAGSYSAGATDELWVLFETSKQFYYGFTDITGVIDTDSDCRNSLLQMDDDTVYSIIRSNNNASYAPTINTKAWTIVDPNGTTINATGNPVIIGAGTSYNSGSNIYTGDYAISLADTLQYNLDTWLDHLGNSYYWAVLDDLRTFSTTHTVTCSDCLCNLYSCLVALDARITANVGNVRVWNELKSYQYQIMWNLLMYDKAERCSEDTTVWCNNLVALINTPDCTCSSGDTTEVTEVIPISTIISGGGGSIAIPTFGTVASGFPVSPTDYSTHTFTNSGSISGVTITTGDLYQYNGSAWIFQINTVGADGANSSSVLYNDCSDDSSGAAGAQTLKTYTTPTTITTDGSYLDIETLWQVNAGVDGTLTIEYATDIPNIIDVPVSTTSTTYIRVFARVHRTSGTTTFVETWYETLGTPNSKVEFAPITTGDDVGAANVIAAVRNLTVGAPADVICKKLTVTVFNL